ncbi:MAG TPA: hypothetical protein VLW85_18485 [Myxococcales bacterium]|nr:hypothetical protein [Myxococcales bacterium]
MARGLPWMMLVVLAGCGGSAVHGGEDAAPASDAGIVQVEPVDSGSAADAGGVTDAGGVLDADGGDAGNPADAGGLPDGGEVADAGPSDAGTGLPDAGAPDGGVVTSPGCPLGGECTYLARTAWWYTCISPVDCQPAWPLGYYGTYEACQTFGCMNGNSRCGDQFGNSDPARWACEECRATCQDQYGSVSMCPAAQETAAGCVLTDSTWGQYIASCICQ